MKGVTSIFRDRLCFLARGDEGVALALSLAFLLPLFVLAVCIYAVQETMVRKAVLQNAVDAAAHSAAVVEADYFSRAALLNKVLGWCYVQRERARGDFAMAKLAYEAQQMFNRDLNDCRKENLRSCCQKRRILNEYYGAGTIVDGKTLEYYRYGNNVATPSANLQVSYIKSISNSSGSICASARPYIINTGNMMEKCIDRYDELGKEHDLAVKEAANSTLRLNLEPFGFDCFAQVYTPKWEDITERLQCSKQDEEMLFRAAGYRAEDAKDPKKILGPGADLWFCRGCDCATRMQGPSWVGRKVWFATLKQNSIIDILLRFVIVRIMRKWLPTRLIVDAAIIAFWVMEMIQQGKDDASFKSDFRSMTGPYRNSCRVVNGPCRVLKFDGNKYLSMEWDFFWKRYARFVIIPTIKHLCLAPEKIIGDFLRVGCHRVGESRASICGKNYANSASEGLTAQPGRPVLGKVIGAKGLKIKGDFFTAKGSVRVVAAMSNPNPLRVFANGSSSTGISGGPFGIGNKIDAKLAAWLSRFDAGGIYQVFNSHESFNKLLSKDCKIYGSQRPDFLFAVAGARAGLRDPRSTTHGSQPVYRIQYPPTEVKEVDWNLYCTDWDGFLVPFRGADYEGWGHDGFTLSPRSGLMEHFKNKFGFEWDMRNPKNWHKVFGPTGTKDKVMDADTLARMEDTRGPYPTQLPGDLDKGFTFLLWSFALDYIQH